MGAEESAEMAERNRAEAVALAVAHQIVTPLSGAVVLETAAQYEQNGLKPAVRFRCDDHARAPDLGRCSRPVSSFSGFLPAPARGYAIESSFGMDAHLASN